MTRISNKCQTFATDGVEIRPAVLSTEEIESVKTEVSVDHEIMRRTGIRNLEKKFESIARIAAAPPVLSIAELRTKIRFVNVTQIRQSLGLE